MHATVLGNTVKHLNKVAFALAVLTCGAAFAQSATSASPWSVASSLRTIRAEFGIATDKLRFAADKVGEGLRLCFGRPLPQSWEIQFGPTFARSRQNDLVHKQTTLGVDWLYVLSRDRVRPFLLIGLGNERDGVSGSALDVDTGRRTSYVNAGLGLQYVLSDRWTSQIDWRRVHGYIGNSNFGMDRSSESYLTLSLSYSFGKRQRP
jgi:OOP family OmpA-OmpF porin